MNRPAGLTDRLLPLIFARWRAGSCPYDSRCTYAHGEHELRYVPPEIVAQLEAQQKMQEAMAARSGGGGGMEQQQPRREEGGGPSLGGGPGGPGSQQTYYKTRLCIKYMQTGSCHKVIAVGRLRGCCGWDAAARDAAAAPAKFAPLPLPALAFHTTKHT